MNERIKELALQAGFGEHWFEQHPTGCALPKPLMLKEYTELLVQECADFLTDDLDYPDAALKLKERFGVEP